MRVDALATTQIHKCNACQSAAELAEVLPPLNFLGLLVEDRELAVDETSIETLARHFKS